MVNSFDSQRMQTPTEENPPPSIWSKINTIGRSEILVGIIVSLVVIYSQLTIFSHAGGLWRDEANSIHLAALTNISDIFGSLQFDTHPAFYSILLGAWSSVCGGTPDMVLRLFGLITGIGLLSVFWINGRLLGFGVPFVSLMLFFQNSFVIRFVDSIRPYGIGILLSMLGYGLMWKMIDSRKIGYFIATTVTMILSVNCLYQSMLTLTALFTGGLLTTIWLKDKKSLMLLLGVLFLSMISLLPYITILEQTASWSVLNKSAFYSKYIFSTLLITLGSPNEWMAWFWVIVLVSGLAGSLYFTRRNLSNESGRRENARLFFCASTIIGCIVFNIWFFWQFEMRPFPWHYLSMMAVVSLSLDSIIVPLLKWKTWRVITMAVIVFFTMMSFNTMQEQLRLRSTNVDLVARSLNAVAKKGDYIFVNPWFYGVSFSRYYTGEAGWSTIPPMKDNRIHRYDQLKEQMQSPDAMEPTLSEIARTLKSGHTIWVAGDLGPLENFHRSQPIPPAPHPKYGWNCVPYTLSWLMRTGYFLRQHVLKSEDVAVPAPDPVLGIENLHLKKLSGWASD